jgi:hypothetical protein
MATRSFTADEGIPGGIGPIDRLPAGAGTILRYQLDVIASTTEDVLQCAGGWLCDRARAGWDVNVLVADGADPRPLAIVGATALDRDEGFLAMVRSASRVGALAVSADLLATDVRVREEILRILKRGLTEVIVWGKQWPAELGGHADPVPHRVSPAARAFKSHALIAANISTDSVSPTETLFRVGTGALRQLRSV